MKDFLDGIDYTEYNFIQAKKFINNITDDAYDVEPIFCAAMFLIKNRFSRAGLGKDFGWSERLRRGMPEYVSAWQSMISNLLPISNLIKDVVFDHGCFRELMIKHDLQTNDKVVSYLDPPYVSDSRVNKTAYEHEMKTYKNESKELTHEGMWEFIDKTKPTYYISGYKSEHYNKFIELCKRDVKIEFQKEVSNHSGQNKKKQKRVEVLWKVV